MPDTMPDTSTITTSIATSHRHRAGRINWLRLYNSDYLLKSANHTARIEPQHVGNGNFTGRIRATISARYYRARIIARRDFRAIRAAKEWAQQEIARLEDLVAASEPPLAPEPPAAPAELRTFEVAVYVDNRATDDVNAHLARRMHAEARRLRLSEPRHIKSVASRESGRGSRQIRVWICTGLVPPSPPRSAAR